MRFFIFLICFFSNSIFANAGDLGVADFNRKKDLEVGDRVVFFTNCGGGVPKYEKCTVQFVGNKLIVDVSKGITPSQVKYFSFYRRGANHSFSLIYEDSNGKISQAGIGTISYKEANALYKAFMNWFNSK